MVLFYLIQGHKKEKKKKRRAVAGGGNGTQWLSVELAACLGWKLINKGRRRFDFFGEREREIRAHNFGC